jgi:hypothetical protein
MGTWTTGAALVVLLTSILLSSPLCLGADKISALIVGHPALIDAMDRIFNYEPSIYHDSVQMRTGMFPSLEDDMKLIRLYFPRNYEKMKTYDIILLLSTEYNLMTNKQDKWIYDVIREGAGGINDGSAFSVVAQINGAWANSLASQAFPNDVHKVIATGMEGGPHFRVEINPNHPEPILTPFIEFGVERTGHTAACRKAIHKEGSEVLAYMHGNFPTRQDYLMNWEYEKGRTITSADFLGNGWLGYPGDPETSNQYSVEIIMNMVFWVTKRPLIDDIEVFHRVKASFNEFRSRLGILMALRDFIDKFGANTQKIQDEINRLLVAYDDAQEFYLDNAFVDSEVAIKEGLALFPEAEDIARREKEAALLWVYVVEWLVASSTLFFSGFVLWTLMVKRRLYHEVKVTKLKESLD